MTSPVERISGPSTGSAPGNRANGMHGRLDAHLGRSRGREGELAERLARGELARGLDEVDADRLARERHRAGGARVRLEDVHGRVRDRELHVEQADDAERGPESLHDVLDLEPVRERERLGREHARRVAGVDTRLLDVLHHRRDVHLLAVTERVDVDLGGVLDEAIDQHRAAHRRHRGAQARDVVTHPHRASSEHVRRPHEHGVADLLGSRDRLLSALDRRPGRAADRRSHSRGRRRAHDPRRGRSLRAGCP